MQKKKRKRKGKKAAVIILVVVLLLLAAGLGYLVLRQVVILDREAGRIAGMDLNTEAVDRTVYASGGYGQAEEAMKSYMAEYAELLQKAGGVLQEEKFSGLLGAENLEEDSPDFAESLAYLDEKEQKAEEIFRALADMASEEQILAASDAAGLNSFFGWLYRREMLGTLQPAMYTESELQPARDSIRESIENRRELLTFLAEESGHWELKNGRVHFDDSRLLDQYNTLAEAVS
jgi:hypothetical protein